MTVNTRPPLHSKNGHRVVKCKVENRPKIMMLPRPFSKSQPWFPPATLQMRARNIKSVFIKGKRIARDAPLIGAKGEFLNLRYISCLTILSTV